VIFEGLNLYDIAMCYNFSRLRSNLKERI